MYVDKTAYLHSLVRQEGNMCFLSRPRRFGKSLTVSTLEAVFQGRRELFKGLAIDKTDYDWKPYPIIHIDFGNCGRNTAEDLEDGMGADALSSFDVAGLSQAEGDMDKVQAFLLQTGYLTIESGNESMLAAFFAKIPYKETRKESDFAQIVDALVAAMSVEVRMASEDRTSAGRIDLTVETGRHGYVMECKADKSAETALRQIKEKRYAEGHTVQDWKEEVLA